MTVLPSPIPHPLDFSPWDLPGWIYEALDWVVGVEWPEGNERAVWELADRWYGVAAALAGPHADAVAAATEVRSGYGGVGTVAAAFDEAWRRVAEGDEAPLPLLSGISTDLGRLVEECGCDIEGAKLEVWIELGILVVELLGLAVATVLTAGAASPAAAAAIAATRAIVQQIFKRLMAQLARKALKQGLKEAGERAAKEAAKGGARGLARRAALGGLYEASEEAGVNLATQAYQNSTGRRHGLDLTEISTSAVGGLAGGAVAPLAGLGRHATGRGARIGEHVGREMTGEVLAEQAASLATGQGPTSLEDAARAAASGVRGSATTQADAALQAKLDGRMSALAGFPTTPATLHSAPVPDFSPSVGAAAPRTDLVDAGPGPVAATAPSTALPSPELTAATRSPDAPSQAPGPFDGSSAAGPQPTPQVDGSGTSQLGQAGRHGADAPAETGARSEAAGHSVPAQAGPPTTTDESPITSSHVQPSLPDQPHLAADPTLTSVASATTTLIGPPVPSVPALVDGTPTTLGTSGTTGHTVAGGTSYPITATAGPTTLPPTVGPTATTVPTLPTTAGIAPTEAVGSSHPRYPAETVTPHGGPPSHRSPVVDDLGGGTGFGATPASGRNGPGVPRPRTPEWYAAQWAADRDAFERRRYRGHYELQRANYEENRRHDKAASLRRAADRGYDEARWLITESRRLVHAGHHALAHRFLHEGRVREQQCYAKQDLAHAILAGASAPTVVDVAEDDFRPINTDVGDLTLGAVETGDRSALTGDDVPPPIDRSRRYGVRGGLRPPLALHQTDVERRMPRHADGTVVRTADPRRGGWFRLMNDGGPAADPTRGINCLDCTLSMFDTWVHGRPRVAAPRTFDAYENGNVTRPLDGEADGPGRIEDVTGGRFQRLCAPYDRSSQADPRRALDAGYRNLHDQLKLGGHGSFAFVINQWEGGGSHIWVALNQNGTVLYLDPQSGEISDRPLGRHRGYPDKENAIDADVLIVGADARPMPLAGLRRGLFSQRPDLPDYPPATEHQGYGDPYLNRIHLLGDPGSVGATDSPSGSSDDSEPLSSSPSSAAPEPTPTARHQTSDHTSLEALLADSRDWVEAATVLTQPTLCRLATQLDDESAEAASRLLSDARVERMLESTWQTDSPRGGSLGKELVRDLLRQPKLVRVLLRSPELAESLSTRPVTLHRLAGDDRAVGALGDVLDDLAERGGGAVTTEGKAAATRTPLTETQRGVHRRFGTTGRRAKQPGFDRTRKGDAMYRKAYLDGLYVSAARAQVEVTALAQRIAQESGLVATAVSRPGPKVRKRAEDKVDKYGGDVSQLTDLAAAAVVLTSIPDVYSVLGSIAADPNVEVVEVEDRFVIPQESGYCDILMMVRASNGHIAELRLHLAAVDEVAHWEHALYQVRRDLKSFTRDQRRSMTSMEEAIYYGILVQQRNQFRRALAASTHEER
ncbi:toxin glutamine deamidase domain-containing protein [Micromonospora endolithica]|uniref:RelA/SpoT domain-containing protein n=1 Tax=Micromonospora endolithica TaxID=230091 RepID=A0A3A9YRK9_9ACTN|nr:toxin glutamine deamidase domain-containing protein [Micromonospora endolithica]RKN38094.1 hypothetical protein D7223_31650 [Micromonospora endolithica]TWJ23877.1 RelA/SpoT family protein [Micromonospora endolithica]